MQRSKETRKPHGSLARLAAKERSPAAGGTEKILYRSGLVNLACAAPLARSAKVLGKNAVTLTQA